MAAMDLSTKQEVMGVQNRYEYGHNIFKPKETFKETDIQGNINLFNTLKTDANSPHDHDSSSLLQVKCPNENKFEVDNDLFSYSSFKKAMDLRTHNRTLDGVRTIFDDAEYFAKNFRYKLLPITLEPVDETVIQFEHNYSLMSLNSESDSEENFSRTMDYSQIKEKNYKRRRTKFRDGSDVDEELLECDASDPATNGFHSSSTIQTEDESLTAEEVQHTSENVEIDNSVGVQPLDLSAAPLVQEKKTDLHLRESPSSIVESEEVAQLDSDKENVNSELNGILVTITRPDEKENYQPCDLFLNDIARLVPRLIGKDCLEVEILDKTCDRHDEFLRKHRLYYVISESTWRLFKKTNERVILTNDQSLGQPIRKAEKDERPTYLVFDQFSLAKCLADYCQEIGGCFEYTCVEEGKEETCCTEEGDEETAERVAETEENQEAEEEKVVEEEREIVDVLQKEEEGEREEETKPEEEKVEQVSPEGNNINDMVDTTPEELTEKVEETKYDPSELEDASEKECTPPKEEKAVEGAVASPEAEEENAPEKSDETKQKPPDDETNEKPTQETPEQISSEKGVKGTNNNNNTKKQSRGTKRKRKSSIQRKPKISRTTPRQRSAPKSETSQKSDKPVSRKGRREPTCTKEEPPNKVTKPSVPEEPYRRTRSGKVLQEVKTNKPTAKKKENGGSQKGKTREIKGRGQKTTKVEAKKAEDTGGRSLRSHKTTQWKEKVQVWPKTKARKR